MTFSIGSKIAAWVNTSEFEAHLLSFLSLAAYRLSGKTGRETADRRFRGNDDFWTAMLEIYRVETNWIKLQRFQLTDWFPRSPGIYHTETATRARKIAQDYRVWGNDQVYYDPDGKHLLLQGGVGSVRFKPVVIDGTECYLCTATSDGYCDSGIPLAIPRLLLDPDRVNFHASYDIVGKIHFLPDTLDQFFDHWSKIPRIYLRVDRLELIEVSNPPVKISPMLFFTTSDKDVFQPMVSDNQKSYFGTYVTCESGSKPELERAADWLEWYMGKYAGKPLTNYDQQSPAFTYAPFGLSQIMHGQIDRVVLAQHLYTENANIVCDTLDAMIREGSVSNSIDFGEGNTFHGNVNAVIAGLIQNSFNEIDTSPNTPDDLKDLLKQLGEHVARVAEALPPDQGESIASDYQMLVKEADKEKPERRRWEFSIEGLKKAAENVGAIGAPVLKLALPIAAFLATRGG